MLQRQPTFSTVEDRRSLFQSARIEFHTETRRQERHQHEQNAKPHLSHSRQLHDYLQGNHTELVRRSLLGHVRVYNELDPDTNAFRAGWG